MFCLFLFCCQYQFSQLFEQAHLLFCVSLTCPVGLWAYLCVFMLYQMLHQVYILLLLQQSRNFRLATSVERGLLCVSSNNILICETVGTWWTLFWFYLMPFSRYSVCNLLLGANMKIVQLTSHRQCTVLSAFSVPTSLVWCNEGCSDLMLADTYLRVCGFNQGVKYSV